MQDLQRRTGGICHDWIRHECNSMKTPSWCCWGIVTFFTAISNVSGNAFMMFGRESDQQPTHSQYSTTSQGRRENSSTTSPPGTIETMRNILDTIIPTQVCSFLVILFLHLYKIPCLEVNHFWQKHFSDDSEICCCLCYCFSCSFSAFQMEFVCRKWHKSCQSDHFFKV